MALAWFLTLTRKHCRLETGTTYVMVFFRPLLHSKSHNALLARSDGGPAAAEGRSSQHTAAPAAASRGTRYHATDGQLCLEERSLSAYLRSFPLLRFTAYAQLQRTLVGEIQMKNFALFLSHWRFQLSLFEVIMQPLMKAASQSLPCQCYRCSKKLTLAVPALEKVIWISDAFWYNRCVPATAFAHRHPQTGGEFHTDFAICAGWSPTIHRIAGADWLTAAFHVGPGFWCTLSYCPRLEAEQKNLLPAHTDVWLVYSRADLGCKPTRMWCK